MADGSLVELTVDGVAYTIELPDAETDYIQGHIANRREPYERLMLADLRARVGPGDVVVDAGANIGNHTLFLAMVAGCRVEAFEPDVELAAALTRSVEANGATDAVRVHALGLGRSRGVGRLVNLDPSNRGGQHLQLGAGEVPVAALDDVEIRRPVRALKIDVEGMELEVLEGAEAVITADRPLIYVECADEGAFGAVAEWLDARGFVYWETFNATPTQLFRPAEEVDRDHAMRRLILRGARYAYRTTRTIDDLRTRLDAANLKYRSATENHRALRERFDAVQARAQALEADRARAEEGFRAATAELATARAELALVRSRTEDDVAALHRELSAAADAREALEARLGRRSAALAESRAQGKLLDAELADLRARLDEVGAALDDARERLSGAQVARAELAAANAALADEASALRARAAELVGEVARRGAHGDRLASALDGARREAVDLTRELGTAREREEGLRTDLAGLAAVRDEALAGEEAARAEVRDAGARVKAAERRLRELRSSVTFRTGQTVRAARTSPRAFFALPARLWRLSRSERVVAASAAPSPSAAPAGVPAQPQPASSRTAPAAPARPSPASADAGRPRLRVAAIVDEFTGLSLAPDCELVHLTPHGWQEALDRGRPDLLFVESAWRGYGGTWHNTVSQMPEGLRQIVRWCRERGVPTAFWNKEDPVHFTTFLTTARQFDHVFTTDMDCVPRYKAVLGHDRVHLLPFAAQPRVHHPIEEHPRKDAFSFAGAYYRRYPERTRDLDELLEHLPTYRPLEIFDRNFGGTDENYLFPEAYQQHIVGTLPPDQVAEAYKGYRFGLNLNSVKQSQSMFARRVFELLASNTVTVSNFSRGVRVMFGDLVVCTDSGREAVRRLRELDEDPSHADRVRLAALRSVMSQHTYADRLAYVMATATGAAVPDVVPPVLVLGRARDEGEAERIRAAVARQTGVRARLVLVADDGVVPEAGTGEPIVSAAAAHHVRVADLLREGELVALLHPDDHYGPHYLFDLLLGTRYATADVLGKRTRACVVDGVVEVVDVEGEYRRSGRLPLRCSVATRAAVRARSVGDLMDHLDDGAYDAAEQLALDRFSYCQGGAGLEGVAAVVDDVDVWPGVPLAELQDQAERATPAPGPGEGQRAVPAATLAEWFGQGKRRRITQQLAPDGWFVESWLPDGEHDYLYATEPIPVAELWPDGVAHVYLDTTPGLDLQFVFLFQDAQGERLGALWARGQQNASDVVPEGTEAVRVGIRARGPGAVTVRAMVLEPVRTEPQAVVGTSRDLVLTNHYPSYENLYRNGFVHSRLRAYRAQGVRAEVFRMRPGESLSFGEFENVDVVTGSAEALRRLLEQRRPRSVLVHFLDEAMWEVLRDLDPGVRVVVWIHGAEVQPWWRRAYNYADDAELEAAKEASDRRLAFWREVFASKRRSLRFVFVSQYFADEVMEDVGVELARSRYAIIHNPIDTDLFRYVAKPAEQRRRVLSIRPFASRKYANDLSVAAILALREDVGFAEMEFRVIGDGPLFEETVAPLRGLPNVTLEQRFLDQGEIARLHREYGVFLVPTRMDAQGVSRDEAMASGLVPVTTRVAAVPEFVDESCGYLAEPESDAGLTDALRDVVRDPERFTQLSRAASARVLRQSAASVVIPQELRLITGERP